MFYSLFVAVLVDNFQLTLAATEIKKSKVWGKLKLF